MTKGFLLSAAALILVGCATRMDISTATCEWLDREIDIAVADMDKPRRDRHYNISPTRPTEIAVVGHIATLVFDSLGAKPDDRIDHPEAYAKKIGLELIRRCG